MALIVIFIIPSKYILIVKFSIILYSDRKTNFPSQIQNEIEEDKQEKFQKKIEMAFVEMINGIILMNCLKWSVKPVIQALHIAKSSNQEFVILLDLKSLIDDTVDKHCCII